MNELDEWRGRPASTVKARGMRFAWVCSRVICYDSILTAPNYVLLIVRTCVGRHQRVPGGAGNS
jgi:hypothetical protein